MQCAICGQSKTDTGLVVFSQHAYAQVVSILKKDDVRIITDEENNPVYVCRDCLQSPY